MKQTTAHQGLAEIADKGFLVLAYDGANAPMLLASDKLDGWTDSEISELQAQEGTVFHWLSKFIGHAPANDANAVSSRAGSTDDAFATLVATFEAGRRIAVYAAHSKEALAEVEIRQTMVTASAIVRASQIKIAGEVTAKEQVYLQQASAGLSDDKIAEDLGLSLRAIKERKRKAIEDMKAKNISHAVAKAKRAGLL